MYKFVFSQQQRHQSPAQPPMTNSETLLTLMFCFNCWIYLHFDDDMRIAQSLQAILAVLSIVFMSYYGFTPASIPYILCTLLTGALLLLSFYFNVEGLFMLIPLIFLLSVDKILNKLKLILEVLLESLWMFFSIMFCFCLFGLISYYFFAENQEYFSTPSQSSLTYLQVATLDNIGKISLQNYERFGFLRSFGMMAASLGIIHLLININQAIIMQYVYSKRHDEETVSTRERFIGEVRVELKVVRIINIIATSVGFLFPFTEETGRLWFLLVMSVISTFSIMFQHWFQANLFSKRNICNILFQALLVGLFLSSRYYLFYLLYTGRIFLLWEVMRLWIKIWQVVWEISELVSFSTIFFLVFTVLSYVLYKVETDKIKIEVVLIRGLQFMTLDDWTANIRHAQWYMSLLIVIYIILLNHIILNALISQAFGQLKMERHPSDCQVHKFMKIRRNQETDDGKSAEQFWRVAGLIGYSSEGLESPDIEMENVEEVTQDLHSDVDELQTEIEGEVNDNVERVLEKEDSEKEVEMPMIP